MTADAKVGLLLGLIFIVMIAFLINGLPNFLQTARAEEAAVDVSVTIPPADDLVIDDRVVRTARHLQRQEVPLRQVAPPEEVIILDGPVAAAVEPAPAIIEVPELPATQPRVQPQTGVKTHKVASGENLAVIARTYYGSEEGNRHAVIRQLYEANKGTLASPDKVCVGQTLIIPPLPALMNVTAAPPAATATTPARPAAEPSLMERVATLFERSDSESTAAAPVVYVVRDGESLWGIAQQQLGDGKRYKEILELNRTLKDADAVVVGTRLKLPRQ